MKKLARKLILPLIIAAMFALPVCAAEVDPAYEGREIRVAIPVTMEVKGGTCTLESEDGSFKVDLEVPDKQTRELELIYPYEPDTYKYTCKMTKALGGVNLDKTEYGVKVFLLSNDDNDDLETVVIVEKTENTKPDKLSFKNTVSGGGDNTPPSPSTPPQETNKTPDGNVKGASKTPEGAVKGESRIKDLVNLAKTGDSNAVILVGIMGALAAIGAVMLIVVKKDRGKKNA